MERFDYVKIKKSDISFSEKGMVICRGVELSITNEHITDYKFQTGMDPIDLIEFHYNESIQVKRDLKINSILNGR